jgi:hypothetical protein
MFIIWYYIVSAMNSSSDSNHSSQENVEYPWYFHLVWVLPIIVVLAGLATAVVKLTPHFAGN